MTVYLASPNGRNAIRLWTDPLAYEVVRDGRTIVGKSRIALVLNGVRHDGAGLGAACGREMKRKGSLATPIYKKALLSLAGNERLVVFDDFAVRLVARDDGVAWRFETMRQGRTRVDYEQVEVALADREAKCLAYLTTNFGCEEEVPRTTSANALVTEGEEKIYLPLVATSGDCTVAITESDIVDYPALYFTRREGGAFVSAFPGFPRRQRMDRNRWLKVEETGNYLVETEARREYPWRVFALASSPAKLCESDIVYALARPAEADFSWVKPGKVAWDWWNDWKLDGVDFESGCNTRTYEYYIDFAARHGLEYVILDEGWSDRLDIWRFNPEVDVLHLIDYAKRRGVGIILWMAWAQVRGNEERVAEHFTRLGAKGFKVDFMDRADADVFRFLEEFAQACAKRKALVDYHGMTRPVGLSRKYPNVVNYEGIHGLEQMKFYQGQDMMANDVGTFFGRLTAGPMDYTPGAMRNFPKGTYPKRVDDPERRFYHFPGSLGTRTHQLAMMAAYEAPLQMLADSPTAYERNRECLDYLAATPTTWDDTVGLGGDFDSFAAVARRKGKTWYASILNSWTEREVEFPLAFLGSGEWKAEIFRDAGDSNERPEHYVREFKRVSAKGNFRVHLAQGGGLAVKFTK